MLILGHPMTNAHHGAPKNWDAERDGPCETLPTISVEHNGGVVHASFWQPDPAELELLNRGGALELHVLQPAHPVVSLRVNAWPGVRHDENGVAVVQEAVPAIPDWRDMKDAPKDGTLLRLLVNPDPEEFTAFDDSLTPFETIGFNNFSNTEEDRWEFAGWDWSQDCFITGRGEVIGWCE